jgi:hypothetical protein
MEIIIGKEKSSDDAADEKWSESKLKWKINFVCCVLGNRHQQQQQQQQQ